MNKEEFIDTHCRVCGSQRCLGEDADLERCMNPEGSYGSRILKEIIREIKNMTAEEYNALHEESLKLDDVEIVLPQVYREIKNE